MNRPTVEVADLIHTQGDRFVQENRSWLTYQQLKVLRASSAAVRRLWAATWTSVLSAGIRHPRRG